MGLLRILFFLLVWFGGFLVVYLVYWFIWFVFGAFLSAKGPSSWWFYCVEGLIYLFEGLLHKQIAFA